MRSAECGIAKPGSIAGAELPVRRRSDLFRIPHSSFRTSHRGLVMTRVLVVDDEPGLRQSLGLLLADAGYEVAAEGNGTRALERALAESFDLVLCDVRMPETDGLAFLRAYKGRGGTALVIMMSAYGGEEGALAAMKEGAYQYVPKPVRPDGGALTLRQTVKRQPLP